MTERSLMSVAQSLYRPWDEENDAKLIEEMRRRSSGLGKAGNAKKVVTADPRGIFQAVSALLITASMRMADLVSICRELHLQRDELNTALRKRDDRHNAQLRQADAELLEARLELLRVKSNESLLWTEVLELRKLKAPLGSSQAGPRVYFEE